MNRLCTICVRSGSKGLPGKNMRLLLGKPLFAHSLRQALRSELFDEVVVSSDSAEILNAARELGATMLVERPAELASDEAPKIPAIQHCLAECEKRTGKKFDTIIDLAATTPLRTVRDIADVVDLLETGGTSSVVSGSRSRHSPYFSVVELTGQGAIRLSKAPAEPIYRRQDTPDCYDLNGSVYGWRRESLLTASSVYQHDTMLHVMPPERSVDIDSELDFRFVELLAGERADLL